MEAQTSDFVLNDLAAKKEPFDKLWSNAVHFHQQHEKWMSGPLLHVNAEEVEEEVRTSGRVVVLVVEVIVLVVVLVAGVIVLVVVLVAGVIVLVVVLVAGMIVLVVVLVAGMIVVVVARVVIAIVVLLVAVVTVVDTIAVT